MSNDDKTKETPFEDRVLGLLEGLDLRMTALETKLTELSVKVDERMRETRPIWERALAEILETKTEIGEIKDSISSINDQIAALSIQEVRRDAEMVSIRRRLSRVEKPPADPNAPTGLLPAK